MTEGLAEPGGICVSARVREDATGKLDLAFRDLGNQQLKNIVAAAALTTPHSQRRIVTSRLTAAAIILAIIGIGATAWWAWPRLSPPATTAQVVPITNPPTASEAKRAPRLSIVVLPFANLSNDPDQQYFADGITEDLTTDLSRLPNMLVIARNTAFTYKGKPADAKQIGRELGVRYLLEGSVQRSANQLRVTVQLIDAETGSHLWAERFDRAVGDVFALQNDVTSRIAVALNVELVAAEAAQPSDKPNALELVLRGRAAMTSGAPTREAYAEAIGCFERALALDPNSIDPQRWLALALTNRVLNGLSASQAEDFRRAEALLAPALAAAPRDPFLHYVKGQMLRAVAQRALGFRARRASPASPTPFPNTRQCLPPIPTPSACSPVSPGASS